MSLVVVGVEALAVKVFEHLSMQPSAQDKEICTLISFSELPLHLEPTEDADMLKKVVLHSVATALARRVLPVPGGPYNRMPCNTTAACTGLTCGQTPRYNRACAQQEMLGER